MKDTGRYSEIGDVWSRKETGRYIRFRGDA
jgi:hypothetical protein